MNFHQRNLNSYSYNNKKPKRPKKNPLLIPYGCKDTQPQNPQPKQKKPIPNRRSTIRASNQRNHPIRPKKFENHHRTFNNNIHIPTTQVVDNWQDVCIPQRAQSFNPHQTRSNNSSFKFSNLKNSFLLNNHPQPVVNPSPFQIQNSNQRERYSQNNHYQKNSYQAPFPQNSHNIRHHSQENFYEHNRTSPQNYTNLNKKFSDVKIKRNYIDSSRRNSELPIKVDSFMASFRSSGGRSSSQPIKITYRTSSQNSLSKRNLLLTSEQNRSNFETERSLRNFSNVHTSVFLNRGQCDSFLEKNNNFDNMIKRPSYSSKKIIGRKKKFENYLPLYTDNRESTLYYSKSNSFSGSNPSPKPQISGNTGIRRVRKIVGEKKKSSPLRVVRKVVSRVSTPIRVEEGDLKFSKKGSNVSFRRSSPKFASPEEEKKKVIHRENIPDFEKNEVKKDLNQKFFYEEKTEEIRLFSKKNSSEKNFCKSESLIAPPHFRTENVLKRSNSFSNVQNKKNNISQEKLKKAQSSKNLNNTVSSLPTSWNNSSSLKKNVKKSDPGYRKINLEIKSIHDKIDKVIDYLENLPKKTVNSLDKKIFSKSNFTNLTHASVTEKPDKVVYIHTEDKGVDANNDFFEDVYRGSYKSIFKKKKKLKTKKSKRKFRKKKKKKKLKTLDNESLGKIGNDFLVKMKKRDFEKLLLQKIRNRSKSKTKSRKKLKVPQKIFLGSEKLVGVNLKKMISSKSRNKSLKSIRKRSKGKKKKKIGKKLNKKILKNQLKILSKLKKFNEHDRR